MARRDQDELIVCSRALVRLNLIKLMLLRIDKCYEHMERRQARCCQVELTCGVLRRSSIDENLSTARSQCL